MVALLLAASVYAPESHGVLHIGVPARALLEGSTGSLIATLMDRNARLHGLELKLELFGDPYALLRQKQGLDAYFGVDISLARNNPAVPYQYSPLGYITKPSRHQGIIAQNPQIVMIGKYAPYADIYAPSWEASFILFRQGAGHMLWTYLTSLDYSEEFQLVPCECYPVAADVLVRDQADASSWQLLVATVLDSRIQEHTRNDWMLPVTSRQHKLHKLLVCP